MWRTLIVAETFAGRLSAFDIHEDGSLSNHRAWAAFADRDFKEVSESLDSGVPLPDGITADSEGAVWIADINATSVARVAPGDTLAYGTRRGASTRMRMADLQHGWNVVTNDGHRIGRIRDVGQHYVEVSPGYFSAAIFIPSSAIANVENQTVHLNHASGEIDAMGWRQPPRSSDELQTQPQRDVNRGI
jgi:hypothetical protein